MNIKIQKIIIITTICLLITTSFSTSSAFQKYNKNNLNQYNSINEIKNETVATCYLFTPDSMTSNDNVISYETGSYLVKLFKESNNDPLKKTELINTLNDLGFIKDKSFNLKKPRWLDNIIPFKSSLTGTSFFCSIASGGTGRITPPILLPRPRGILLWKGYEDPEFAYTSVGSLRTDKGFIAYGSQQGTAIGFVGLGMTYWSPYGTIYGFTGYALYTSVTADDIEFYPPNSKPVISNPIPSNNQENIPTTISELSFRIYDDDIELMDYSVTTDPDIGSGSKNNVINGIYSISVDRLQPSTIYTWTVTVTDGKDTTENTYRFTTEYVEPEVSDPYPSGIFVDTDLKQLRFTLTEPQGELMDYIVETSPYIGFKQGSDVSDGTYTVPIQGLVKDRTYTWYVNVTDGTYWTKETYIFSSNEDRLIGYWSFDEGSGIIAHDMSGFGNNGLINGATWINGHNGKALSFDGINDYVSVPTSVSLRSADETVTIASWVYVNGWYNSWASICAKSNDKSRAQYGIAFTKDGRFDIDLAGTKKSIYTNFIPQLNTWIHIAFTWNGDTIVIYINGENIASDFYSPTPQVNDYGLELGRHTPVDTEYMNGILDEIRIYNKALSEEEIQELYLNQNN